MSNENEDKYLDTVSEEHQDDDSYKIEVSEEKALPAQKQDNQIVKFEKERTNTYEWWR